MFVTASHTAPWHPQSRDRKGAARQSKLSAQSSNSDYLTSLRTAGLHKPAMLARRALPAAALWVHIVEAAPNVVLILYRNGGLVRHCPVQAACSGLPRRVSAPAFRGRRPARFRNCPRPVHRPSDQPALAAKYFFTNHSGAQPAGVNAGGDKEEGR